MKLLWKVDSQRTPIELEIDDEELSELDSDEERDNFIYDAVMSDFQDKIGIGWEVIEEYKPVSLESFLPPMIRYSSRYSAKLN